jgi:O-antigen/teichoic acid export membrane protein
MSTSEGATRSLNVDIARGLGWKLSSQLFLQLSRILVVIILARLLAPEDFGLAAMVLVFTGIGVVFTDLALGAALIRRRTLTEMDRSTAFWTSVALGAGFTTLGVVLAGPVAQFYGEAEVEPLFAVASSTFVVIALGTTQTALLAREMRFKSLELRSMAGVGAGAVAAIATAALGGGAWAIIAQQLAMATVSTFLLWSVSSWRPRLLFSITSLRELTGFSMKVFGTNVLFYLNRNTDNLLIGRFLGAAALGAYTIAYTVMLYPLARIAAPIRDVLFPAFSMIQDEPERIGAIWLRANRLVAAIALPALAGMMVVAPDFVPVVFGEQWDDAVPVLQILAWVGLLQALQRLNGSVLQARDRAGTQLRFAVFAFVASIAAFAIGVRWGIVGVAAAFAIATSLIQPLYTWVTARAVNLPLSAVARNLSGVVQTSLIMLAAVIGARLLLLDLGVSRPARLTIVIAIGAAVYAGTCVWRAPEVFGEIRALGRLRTRASGGPQSSGSY